MAKPRSRARKKKYGTKASKKVGRAMHEMKRGELKSGRSGRTVKSRKQAIAIGLSEARMDGAKVPKKRAKKKPAKKEAKRKTRKSPAKSQAKRKAPAKRKRRAKKPRG